jgi:hypothetical protein
MLRRIILLAAVAWLATVAYKKLAPDVKRYVEMSRM